MAWFREEMVVFRSTFDSPWFGSFRAPGDSVAGEGTEEQAEEFRVTGRACQCSGREIRSPLANGITCSLETDTIERGWSPSGGFGHDGSDGIVGEAGINPARGQTSYLILAILCPSYCYG